ncbi:MAG: ribbon-helix-helix domain-containing protein [Archaeoglobaceae archaeon]
MVKKSNDGIKVGVKLPKQYVEEIDKLIFEGKFLSRADFVRECVRMNFEKVKEGKNENT